MSSDDTPPYEPNAPHYGLSWPSGGPNTGPNTGPHTGPNRTPRRGPLSARLAARTRSGDSGDLDALGAPADDELEMDDTTPPLAEDDYAPGYAPGGPRETTPSLEALSSALHTPGGAAQSLSDMPNFGAQWESRGDMLEACLDQYYQLTARYNDTRALLDQTQGSLPPLHQQRDAAQRVTRELEKRIELHSRGELREAYLGLAEAETRVFRAEQDCYLLASRIETLENFLGFLSRVIATVRTIPASALEQSAPEAAPSGEDEYEEVTLDAATAAALIARGEGELIGEVGAGAPGGQGSDPQHSQLPPSGPVNHSTPSNAPVQ